MRGFLALGDSYTIGEGVPAAARWPLQLAARLGAEGLDPGKTEVLATTGWTTDELAAAMDQAAFAPPYRLVSLLIGVNNQYRGRDLGQYAEEFRALLARATALAGGAAARTLVLSIPDWGVTPYARASGRDPALIAAEIDRFNEAARAQTLRAGAAWVDVTPISRAHADLLAADGLHPSAEQYALWAAAALPAAGRALAAQPH